MNRMTVTATDAVSTERVTVTQVGYNVLCRISSYGYICYSYSFEKLCVRRYYATRCRIVQEHIRPPGCRVPLQTRWAGQLDMAVSRCTEIVGADWIKPELSLSLHCIKRKLICAFLFAFAFLRRLLVCSV